MDDLTLTDKTNEEQPLQTEVEPTETLEPQSDDQSLTTDDDPVKALEARLEVAEQKQKEAYDRYLRAVAEFENFKKRSAREAENFKKFANELLLKDLLPVVDNLERAIQSSSGEGVTGGIVEGVDLTLKEILKVLERYGVKPVESVGKPFDPNFHEAVMQEETDDHPEQTVIREFQKGYLLHDRLLRPAMTVVSKAKTSV